MDKQSNNPSLNVIRVIVFLPVLLMLIYAAYLCFRWAWADVLLTQVRFQMEKVTIEQQPLDAEQWALSRHWLEKSLSLHQDFSDNLEMAAFFYNVAASQPEALVDELGWHDSAEKSLYYSRRALRLRPSWPYLWVELILSKLALEQFDDELTGALERALTLGPWEGPVLEDIAFSGLEYWDELNTDARKSIYAALDKTFIIQNNKGEVVKELKDHENFAQFCTDFQKEPVFNLKLVSQNCQK